MVLSRGKSVGLRFVLILLILAGVFTFMSASDIIQDLNGSHLDWAKMDASDFKDGDVIEGTVEETLGLAMTLDTTEMIWGLIPTNTHTAAYYYLVPFYDNATDLIPARLVLYRTGNSAQVNTLDRLTDETSDWYSGYAEETYSKLSFDRGVVSKISSEELSTLKEVISDFVTYNGGDDEIMKGFIDAIVPYVVQFRADVSFMLYIGLAIFGVLLITLIIILVLRKGRRVPVGSSGYISAAGGSIYGEDPFSQSAAQQFSPQGGDIGDMPAPPSNPFATKQQSGDIGDMPAPPSNPFATKQQGGDIGDMPAPPSNPFATKTAEVKSGETADNVGERESLFEAYGIPVPQTPPASGEESLFFDGNASDTAELLVGAPSQSARTPDTNGIEDMFPQTSSEDFVTAASFGEPEDENSSVQSEFESMLMGDND